jgi:hypothetical protein
LTTRKAKSRSELNKGSLVGRKATKTKNNKINQKNKKIKIQKQNKNKIKKKKIKKKNRRLFFKNYRLFKT